MVNSGVHQCYHAFILFKVLSFILGPPTISMPAIVRAFPGHEVKCSVTGSPPIYTAILNGSTVLVNTTSTAKFHFSREGNISCVATSKYGSDFRIFAVLGKPLRNRW